MTWAVGIELSEHMAAVLRRRAGCCSIPAAGAGVVPQHGGRLFRSAGEGPWPRGAVPGIEEAGHVGYRRSWRPPVRGACGSTSGSASGSRLLSPSPTAAPTHGACVRTRAEVRDPCWRGGALGRATSPGIAVRVVAILARAGPDRAGNGESNCAIIRGCGGLLKIMRWPPSPALCRREPISSLPTPCRRHQCHGLIPSGVSEKGVIRGVPAAT